MERFDFIRLAAEAGFTGEAVWLSCCDSTNDAAKTLAKRGAPDLSAVVADRQTGGKGRLARSWASDTGGLYLSALLRPKMEPEKASLLPHFTALCVCAALESLNVSALIKWPNDIVSGGRKICGILLETGFSDGFWAVCGIGVNIRQEGFEEELTEKAASLKTLGYDLSVETVLRAILTQISARCEAFYAMPESILPAYKEKCVTLGGEVTVTDGGGGYRAKALDIAADGALVIDKNGEIKPVYAGDVSVRGVMGYV